jgi:hypothetical protein
LALYRSSYVPRLQEGGERVTVYVDNMRARFRRMVMCHMLADSDDELHTMADRIGVARRWWQSPTHTSGSQYDIALSKRALAVAAGAVEISLREASAMNARRRVTGELGSPGDAVAWLLGYMRERRAACRDAAGSDQKGATEAEPVVEKAERKPRQGIEDMSGVPASRTAVEVWITSNAGRNKRRAAVDIVDALAIAAAARITENHMVCVEVDQRRVLRWDRDRVIGENCWRPVNPEEFETLGAIRQVHRAKGHPDAC